MMKNIKRILGLLYLFLFSTTVFGQVVSITQNSNSISIHFKLPAYSIGEKTSEVGNNPTLFNSINLTDVDNVFGSIEDAGYPELPQITVDLQIPDNAVNINAQMTSITSSSMILSKKIIPVQEDYYTNAAFSMNQTYYQSTGSLYNFNYKLSEPYKIVGTRGVSFTILPFTYNPLQNRLDVLSEATFTIHYSTPSQAPNTPSVSAVQNAFLANFFNYHTIQSGPFQNDLYLIVTKPSLESTLTPFINYKRNIGYDVKVVNTNITGTTASSITNYLKNEYSNTKMTFVLLVGDYSAIPPSGGTLSASAFDDPMTDLYYARLDGDDYLADVFLARFPATNTVDLRNMIHKSIYMETHIHKHTKKVKFIAGDEENAYMRNNFQNGHDNVAKETFDKNGYGIQKLYRPSSVGTIIDGLNDNPLFFIYSGHGGEEAWIVDDSPSLNFPELSVNSAQNTVYPFVFAFACKTGFYPNDMNIGLAFIKSAKGGVTYFGSSVNTMVNSDVAIEKKIFDKNNMPSGNFISVITTQGMIDYKKRFWSALNQTRTKRYLKSYNLLGDPSLSISGIPCVDNLIFKNNERFESGIKIRYRAKNIIQDKPFVLESGANVVLESESSISLNPGFSVATGSYFEVTVSRDGCN